MTAQDFAFNPPRFDSPEYDPVKMRVLVEELERLHAALTSDVDDEGDVGYVLSFNSRTGDVTPQQSDYDTFFLTPSEGDAAYLRLDESNDNNVWGRLADDETVTGAWNFSSETDFDGNVDINGGILSIFDDTGVDGVSFEHDGTDLNVTGTSTANINLTGITSLQAGTVDADFDAITATTYGGISEDDLVDKTATESVTGDWTFTGTTVVPEATITDHEAAIDHDALTNFVAAEHIDWSSTGAEDIHVDRITSAAITQHEAAIDHDALTNFVANEHRAWETSIAQNIHADNITEGSITQHEAALTILESQITDGSILARLADNETVTGSWTFTGQPTISNSAPRINLVETDAGADETRWRNLVSGSIYYIETLTDAGAAGAQPFRILRTGTTVDEIELNATLLDFNGAADFSSTVDISGALTATSYGGISEANLLDKSAAETVSGAYTFTSGSGVRITHAAPRFILQETGGTADEQVWDWRVDASVLSARLLNDAESAAVNWLRVLRTGTTIDEIELNATTLDFNGAADFSSTLRAANGSAGAPTYSFSGDTDTGMFLLTTNNLAFSAGGSEGLRVRSVDVLLAKPLKIQERAAAVSDNASYGQIWVLNEAPNELWFTNDAGDDFHVAGGAWDVFRMSEQATAGSIVAGEGQLFTRNYTPNELWFVDDSGGYFRVAGERHNIQNGSYTLLIQDAERVIHKASGGAGETYTIPANSSVPFPIGTAVAFSNSGGGDLTIAITTDTLVKADDGSTGSRTLADDGLAVAIKVNSTLWKIAGDGLS